MSEWKRDVIFVLVITWLRGKFGINLPSSLLPRFKFTESSFHSGDFKISKNERGKFSPNFTNKHVIPGQSHVTSSQRAHKGKSYTKNNQLISTNLIKITATLQ